MQTAYPQLKTHLDKQLLPIYILHGDEILLQQEARDAIIARAKALGFTQKALFSVSGAHFDWSEVLAVAQNQSLFAEKTIIDVRIPTGKVGKEGGSALMDLAQALVSLGVQADCMCVLSLPRADKATKNSAWFTALEKVGVSVQIPSVERKDLAQWIGARLKAQGLQCAANDAGTQALQFLCLAVEGNLFAAHQEIEKLALLYPNRTNLTLEQVRIAVSDVSRFHAFQLSGFILKGDRVMAQRILEALEAEGETPILAHYVMSEDVRKLYAISAAIDAGQALPVALSQAQVWGEKQALYEGVLRGGDSKAKQKTWRNLLYLCQRVDGVIKGLPQKDLPQQPWQAMHHLAQAMCGAN